MGAASSCVRRRMDARAARPYDIEIGLLRVELDDELFLDREPDVFALRKIRDRTAELIRLELEPLGNAASGGRLDGLADLIVLAALFPHLNHVALADLIGGDVDLLAVDLDVAVADELPRLGAGGCEAEGVDHVVEPELELAEQVVTGDAGARGRAVEVDPELILEQAVNALDLLFLAKLDTVSEHLGTAASVLAGRVIAALDGALVLETAV